MATKKPRPRCTIQILNVRGKVVPILDEGAQITPGSGSKKYREYWTEEEDLDYVFRQVVIGPDGGESTIDRTGGVHGNIGYELLVSEATQKAVLRIDYFTVSPMAGEGPLGLSYEPKSVTVTGTLKQGATLQIDVELQAGFSEQAGRPDFKYLRVKCR